MTKQNQDENLQKNVQNNDENQAQNANQNGVQAQKSEKQGVHKKMDDLKSNLKGVAQNFKIKELEDMNQKMGEKIKELEDKNLRLYADIDNIHKQNSLDLPRYKKMGKESVLNPVLNFLSTLHIAFSYAPKSDDENIQKYVDALKGSFEKLKKELLDLNIEVVEPKVGEKFDPNLMHSLNETGQSEAEVANVVSLGLKVDGVLSNPATVMIK